MAKLIILIMCALVFFFFFFSFSASAAEVVQLDKNASAAEVVQLDKNVALSFKVKNSKAQNFRYLILSIQRLFGEVKNPYEFRVVPKIDVKKTFDASLKRDEGEVKCLFRKRDLYFVYREIKDKKYFFKDVNYKIYATTNFEVVPLESSYSSLKKICKADRNQVVVGGGALYGAVASFITPKSTDSIQLATYNKNLAQACIVVIEMLAECARFQYTLRHVMENV